MFPTETTVCIMCLGALWKHEGQTHFIDYKVGSVVECVLPPYCSTRVSAGSLKGLKKEALKVLNFVVL